MRSHNLTLPRWSRFTIQRRHRTLVTMVVKISTTVHHPYTYTIRARPRRPITTVQRRLTYIHRRRHIQSQHTNRNIQLTRCIKSIFIRMRIVPYLTTIITRHSTSTPNVILITRRTRSNTVHTLSRRKFIHNHIVIPSILQISNNTISSTTIISRQAASPYITTVITSRHSTQMVLR